MSLKLRNPIPTLLGSLLYQFTSFRNTNGPTVCMSGSPENSICLQYLGGPS